MPRQLPMGETLSPPCICCPLMAFACLGVECEWGNRSRLQIFPYGNKRQKSRTTSFSCSRNRILAEHTNGNLHRATESTCNPRLERADHPYFDRFVKMKLVHRRCHHLRTAMALRANPPTDIDPLHHLPPKCCPQCIAVRGKNQLIHHGERFFVRLRFHRHFRAVGRLSNVRQGREFASLPPKW